MKTTMRWMAFGAGVGSAALLGRALLGNTAGVVAAILSDFEARRTEVPLPTAGAHRTSRSPSSKLPTRLKADIEYARSAAAKQTISLVEAPAPIAR